MKVQTRLVWSVICIVLASIIHTINTASSTIIAGNMAGMQFDNSNISYGASQFMSYFTGTGGWITVAMLGALAALWYKPAKNLLIAPLVIFALLLGSLTPAHAYYDKQDWAEVKMILPNESAFWVPDVGANMNSQVKFGSEAYYERSKIASKRFVIPHTKLDNSGLWSNYYVPAGRLIIVDRTPYNREWTKSSTRGSSKSDQSFPCQSAEGLNITAEVGIATSVHEEDAAKFLYFFGVKNPSCDTNDPACVFTSIYRGKSLEEVMDTVGRGLVQTATCQQLSSHSLDQDNVQAASIMEKVEQSAQQYLATRGITLDYIGWAGTFSFDNGVQDAINKRYISTTVAAGMPVLENLANVKVKEGLGGGLEKYGLPKDWLIMPQNLDLTSILAGHATK